MKIIPTVRSRAARAWPAFALFAALGACHRAEPPPVAQPEVDGDHIAFPSGSRFAEVLSSAPVEAAAGSVLVVPGRLAWDDTRTARVFAAMAGQIAAINARPGDAVKAGQALALIASPAFGEAQSERVRAEADLHQAERQRRRSRELQDAGVIAARELEEAENAYVHALAEAERTRARARLYGDGARVDQRLALRSPIDGVVVERRINPGQEVAPEQAQGDGPALFTVSDPTRLWLLLDLPEGMAMRVQPGQRVRFAPHDDAAAGFEAEIEHVDDFVDADTRSVRVRATIDNAARRLKAGMYVQAELALPSGGGFDVPAAAVLLIDGDHVVFVDEGDGRYRRQPVQTAEASAGRMHVADGLGDGERVVVAGALYLQQLLTAQATQ